MLIKGSIEKVYDGFKLPWTERLKIEKIKNQKPKTTHEYTLLAIQPIICIVPLSGMILSSFFLR